MDALAGGGVATPHLVLLSERNNSTKCGLALATKRRPGSARSLGSGRYYASGRSRMTRARARKAMPRCEMASFSAGVSSALVTCWPSAWKIGS